MLLADLTFYIQAVFTFTAKLGRQVIKAIITVYTAKLHYTIPSLVSSIRFWRYLL